MQPPAIPSSRDNALPFSYINGFYNSLKSCDCFVFKTFSDLKFDFERRVNSEEELRALYTEEFAQWREEYSTDNSGKIELYIMHDCDSGPEETVYLCEYESSIDIRSTTALFVQRRNKAGQIVPYNIDYGALLNLQGLGQCFSYHCNVAEYLEYDETNLVRFLNDDVAWLLNTGFEINFYAPHGGRRSASGRNNNDFFYPSLFERNMIWTHNRFAPKGARYSDGALLSRLRAGDPKTNLLSRFLDIVAEIMSGKRAPRIFILLHPQYYFSEQPDADIINSANCPDWYKSVWDAHGKQTVDDYWKPLVDAVQARGVFSNGD